MHMINHEKHIESHPDDPTYSWLDGRRDAALEIVGVSLLTF